MQISIKTFREKLRKELSNEKTKPNNWCFVKIIHHRQFLYYKPVIEFINCDPETNLAIFAFALGQKALRSPGFPKCFSEVFLGELIKFFFFFFEILDLFYVAPVTRIGQISLEKWALNLKTNLFFLTSVNRYSWNTWP